MIEIKKKLPLFLTQKEIETLLKNVIKSKHRTGIALMSLAGLRVSEVCNLKIKDINFPREFIRVHGKGGKERFVPLTSRLQSILQSHIEKCRNIYPDSLLVGSTRVAWHYTVKKYSELAFNRSDIHCHTLRHSFATALYDKGVQLEKISELLGHSKLDTTMIYSHISIEQKKEAVSVLDSKSDKITRFFEIFKKRAPEMKVKNRGVLIGRDSELKEIKALLLSGKSIVLSGKSGVGKSAILKNFSDSIYISEYKKKKTLIDIVANSVTGLEPGAEVQLLKDLKKCDIDSLLEMIAGIKKLIVFDNITDLTKSDKKVISDLSKKTQIITSSSKKTDIKLFDTFVNIKPLNRYYTRMVLSEMIYTASPRTKERIVDDMLHSSGDNLKQAEYLANQLQLGKSTEDIINDERENNQVSITPVLLIMVLFFCSYAIKSYAPSYVAFSYAMLVVFRIFFYRFLFAPLTTKKRSTT